MAKEGKCGWIPESKEEPIGDETGRDTTMQDSFGPVKKFHYSGMPSGSVG